MRLPWQKKSLTGSPNVLEALQNRTGSLAVPLAGGVNEKLINQAFFRGQSATYGWLYKHRPAVRMVVDYIASNFAQLPLKLYERVDDENRQRDYEHPAAITMQYPNGEYSRDSAPAKQFIRGVITDYLIFDRATVLKFRRGDGGPLILQRVPPTLVLPYGGRYTTEYYRVFRTDGSWEDWLPENVIHWHGYNPDDELIGWSKLETLRDSLTEDNVSQTTTVELMKNGLKGGHIERPLEAPNWTPEAQQRFREGWANQRSRSPRLDPVLEEGMKWVPTAMTPKDAEMLAGRQWTVDEVAAVYNFPADLLRRAAGEAGELVEARKQFYADTLPPLTENLAEQLDMDLLISEYDAGDHYFEFDLNEKLRGDPVARFAAITSAVGAPWLTRNEARALENRPAIDGGDEVITPLNVVVGDNPRPAPNVMPPQNPNGPPQDGSHREQQTASLEALVTKAVKDAVAELASAPAALEKASEPIQHKAELISQLVPKRKADLARQQRYIDDAQGVMEKYYARQARALRKKDWNGNAKASFDSERWDRELSTDLEDLLRSIVEREGGIYVARLAGEDFDMRMVTNYIKAQASGAASAINDVTKADIEDMGLDDAMSRARNERSIVAAASLGARSTIFARLEAAKQAPHYELRTKTWVADTDRHAEFDGDQVPIGDDWPAGFAPGSQPNCGCTASID